MERVIDKLPPIFAILGLLGLLGAAGLYLFGGDVGRYALPLAAASLCLIIYYFVERPQGLVRLVTGRSARYGSNAFLMSASFIAILVLLNVLGTRYTARADLTANQLYTLSPQTINILKNLKTPVKAIAFVQAGQQESDAQSILDQFTHYTKNLSVQYVDPVAQPGVASQYNVQYSGTVVLVANGKQQQVMSTSEADLISGIVKITRGTPEKVYFIVGNGEPDPNSTDSNGFSQAKSALESEDYTVATLNLLSAGKVPADAAVVILVGPTSSLQPSEMQAFTDYLDKGGTALILADTDKMAGLTDLLARYDVQLKRGIIVDLGQSYPNDPTTPVITSYLTSPITQNMYSLATLFPTVEMVAPSANASSGNYTVTPLMQTTANSWLETNPSSLQSASGPTISASDVTGPVDIAVSVLANSANAATKKTTRLVVVGDVDFASNAAIDVTGSGNRDLFLNSVDWLAEEEDLIAVRAKDTPNNSLLMTGNQVNLVGFVTIGALPLLLVGVAAFVYWGKR